MNDIRHKGPIKTVLNDRDFLRLSKFIHSECGIKMPPAKRVMLQSRLQKRLRKQGLDTFSEYCNYLFSPQGIENELVHMIDVVTTNKTDFYREPRHFDYLTQHALPELINKHGSGINRDMIIWSAGCSTGEEPYTLAMVLSEFAENCPGFKFRRMVLATDISSKVLEKARSGIYEQERIIPVPEEQRKKYLLKSRDKSKGQVRITPALRASVKFRRLNFLQDNFGMHEPVEIIFCRNVIIYFDKATQEILLNRFSSHLKPGGYVFLGHSETLHGLNVPLVQVAPTIYRKSL